jgi:hypothetical protein
MESTDPDCKVRLPSTTRSPRPRRLSWIETPCHGLKTPVADCRAPLGRGPDAFMPVCVTCEPKRPTGMSSASQSTDSTWPTSQATALRGLVLESVILQTSRMAPPWRTSGCTLRRSREVIHLCSDRVTHGKMCINFAYSRASHARNIIQAEGLQRVN